MDAGGGHAAMMTTANKITVGRILLIPVFIYLLLQHREHGLDWQRWAALGCFALAAVLDGVDGFVARRFHQKSELGAVLDPLADKLLLVSALILLSLDQRHLSALPPWLNLAIISRDALVVLGLGVVHFTVGKVTVRPRWTGKVATVLQMAVVLWTLLKWPATVQWWLAAAAVGLTLVSGTQYLFDGMRQLSASPRSAAMPEQ
jgi:cardiolipin synthase